MEKNYKLTFILTTLIVPSILTMSKADELKKQSISDDSISCKEKKEKSESTEEEIKRLIQENSEIMKEVKQLREDKENNRISEDEAKKIRLLRQLTNLALKEKEDQNWLMQMYSSSNPISIPSFDINSMPIYNPYTSWKSLNDLPDYSQSFIYPSIKDGIDYYGMRVGRPYFLKYDIPNNVYDNSTNDFYYRRSPTSFDFNQVELLNRNTIPNQYDPFTRSRNFDFSFPQGYSPLEQPSFPQLSRDFL